MSAPGSDGGEVELTAQAPRRCALVTGGARGIGRAIAGRLLEEGLEVIVADRAPPPGGLGEIHDRIEVHRADVGDPRDVQRLAEVLGARGAPDVLVNNAGLRGPTAAVTHYPVEDWEEVLRVNLEGAFLCARAFAPAMEQRGWGRIVNIASVAGKIPYPLRSAYGASKWGLIGLTLTLAQELGPRGITVNAVCPGPVENDAMSDVFRIRATATGRSVEEVRREYLERLAVPRMPCEADVAAMVAYLVSEEAGTVTGQALDVSSGYRA